MYLVPAENAGVLGIGSVSGAGGLHSAPSAGTPGASGRRCCSTGAVVHPARYRFSLVRTCPRALTNDNFIAREAVFVEKPGTRVTGLNLN